MKFGYQTNWQTVKIGGRIYCLSASRVYDPETARFLSRDPVPSMIKVVESSNGSLGVYTDTILADAVLIGARLVEDNPQDYAKWFLNIYRSWSNNAVNEVDPAGMFELGWAEQLRRESNAEKDQALEKMLPRKGDEGQWGSDKPPRTKKPPAPPKPAPPLSQDQQKFVLLKGGCICFLSLAWSIIPGSGAAARNAQDLPTFGDKLFPSAPKVPNSPSPPSTDPSSPVGRRGSPLTGTGNPPARIPGGTPYSSSPFSRHALVQMQNRGFTPSIVREALREGLMTPGNTPGTTVFYDVCNKVKVVFDNKTGNIITVIPQ